MMYDLVTTSPTKRIGHGWDSYETAHFRFSDRSRISCAFAEVSGDFPANEDLTWQGLCFILTKAKQQRRPILVPITEKESLMLSLLEACPYARPLVAHKSRHGDYLAYLYCVEVP